MYSESGGPAAHLNPLAEARSRPVQASAPQPAYDLLLSRDEKLKLAKSATAADCRSCHRLHS
jgi:hypothetical protein